MLTCRGTRPPQTHKPESLRRGPRSPGDSYLQPGLAPMAYSMLTPHGNIKNYESKNLNITSASDEDELMPSEAKRVEMWLVNQSEWGDET